MKIPKLRYFLLVMILLLAASAAQAAKERPIEVTAAIENKEVYVGDRILLDVVAENASGYEISFPEAPAETGEFTFIESRPLKARRARRSAGQVYVMSIYTTGTHVIPPIEVKYRKKGQAPWSAVQSPQVPVEIRSLLTGEDLDIVGVKGLIGIGSALPRVILGFLIIFVIAILAFYFFWRKRRELEGMEARRARTAHEIAHEQLRRLKKEDLPRKGKINEYYVRLSDIIRRYLENRFAFRAPEMTTEEFLEFLKGSPELEEKHKKQLEKFLSHCDMVKFAKYGPTPLEVVDSFNAAENLVDQTRFIEEEAEEE